MEQIQVSYTQDDIERGDILTGLPENIWFSADAHFLHHNILKYCNRPFASLKEMEETLINNWNKIIRGNDTAFYLGDFSMNPLVEGPV